MPVEIQKSRFYTLPEIKDLIGISVRTLRRYICEGMLEARRVGRSYLVQDFHFRILLERGTRYDEWDDADKRHMGL